MNLDPIQTTAEFPHLAAMAAEPFEARGILHSEMALIVAVCAAAGVEVVIESGRARGQSTYMLAKYLPNAIIHSVELRKDEDAAFAERRLRSMRNVHLYYGNGIIVVPDLCRKFRLARTAVILDGPKGNAALDVLAQCEDATIGFVHDMRALDHGKPSPYRAEAERRYPGNRAFYSDHPDYVAATSWMDTACAASSDWEPGKFHQPNGTIEELGSYGPTVGVFWL